MTRKILFCFSILLVILFKPSFARAQDCGGPIPPAPAGVKAVSGPRSGEVTLFWQEASYANRYAVAYGKASNNYLYGANNIGGESSRSYTVKSLIPGVRYYFRVAAARDCSSSPFSLEVSAVARAAKVEVKGEDKKVSVGAPVSVPKAAAEPVTVVKAPISGPVGKARLSARPGPKAGEVTLFWQHVDSAEDYHLVYGRAPGKYEYGALNIGRVNRFTVRQLSPGATYYFAIIPIFGQPLYTTEAVKAVAKMNITVIQTTPEALGKPTVELNKPSPPVVSEQPTITPPGEKTGGPTVPSSTPSAQPQVNPLED